MVESAFLKAVVANEGLSAETMRLKGLASANNKVEYDDIASAASTGAKRRRVAPSALPSCEPAPESTIQAREYLQFPMPEGWNSTILDAKFDEKKAQNAAERE